MIIKKIAFGDATESYIEDSISSGFNIIYSNDNNKGKTIVIQSALYAMGNEPIFPSTFPFEEYCHYVEIEIDDGSIIELCRKGSSFMIKVMDSIYVIDSVSELKRFLNRNGMTFPVIIKDGTEKMVDPVLLYQLFFVGQDNKNTSTIFFDQYYKKEDFWNLIFSFMGLGPELNVEVDYYDIKRQISLLQDEQKVLLSQNKILKKDSASVELLSQKRQSDAFAEKIKKIESLRKSIIETSKNRNRALQRKTINEKTLKEIRSLNRTPDAGALYCIDCGSKKIGYSSGDKSYTFDISDAEMRKNILESIEDKIAAYQEEIDSYNNQLNKFQEQLQELLKDNDINLETVLIYKNGIVDASEADSKLVEIDKQIKSLQTQLNIVKSSNQEDKEKRENLKKKIIAEMNRFYQQVDPTGTIIFDDLFSKRKKVYSGVETTEFYLSKLYALATVLDHNYPIIMDFFRDGELSTEKEAAVLELFSKLPNQIIFTATLKEQEMGKYSKNNKIHTIDYSNNASNHILSKNYSEEFKELLKPLLIDLS